MPLARAVCLDSPEELELALRRLGLPSAAREYLLEKLPHAQVLLTGLSPEEVGFLRAEPEEGTEPLPSFLVGDRAHQPGTGLLQGSRAQLSALVLRARERAFPGLADALEPVLVRFAAEPRHFELRGRRYPLGERTYVMGVVNVTPDSFSDGGRYLEPEAAVAHGEALAAAGADLLDLGGESTRPGASPVSEEEELRRVLPVITALAARVTLPLSVDTRRAAVAARALEAGASLVNDVTGFQGDPALAGVVARAGAACCLMHMQGTPQTMQAAPAYGDVVEEVVASLREGVARARGAGVPAERILVDPGIGFGKTVGHNLFLLRRLADLRALGLPILAGTSRKSFLGAVTGGKGAGERLAATLGSIASLAVLAGADVVRVHDVTEAKDALAVALAIRTAREGGSLWARGAGR